MNSAWNGGAVTPSLPPSTWRRRRRRGIPVCVRVVALCVYIGVKRRRACARAPDDGRKTDFFSPFERSRLGNSFFSSVLLSPACGARHGRRVTNVFFFSSLTLPCFFPSPPPFDLPHTNCPCSGTCLLEIVAPLLTPALLLICFSPCFNTALPS